MKLKTALKSWTNSYRLSWHCISGRYYGWPAELAMLFLCTLFFPLLLVLTMIFSKEPDDAA